MAAEIKEYTPEIEQLFLQFMISDPDAYIKVSSILDPANFESSDVRDAVEFVQEYANKYTKLPTTAQIKASTGVSVELLEDTKTHDEWFCTEFEEFTRHKTLESVILNSVKLLEEKRYGEVESKVKAAVQLGLVKDLGTDYFDDPVKRLEAIKDNSSLIPTGWRDFDHKLYGGFNRGEITIFAGQSGAGKSLFLQNLCVNYATSGLNAVYITLELSENLTAMRLDAMVSGVETKGVLKNIDDVAMKVKTYGKKHKGSINLKQLPNGCTINDIRSYVKELETKTGRKCDAILVDYLDLMSPAGVKVSASDQFIKDKYVSEELRNLAIELDVLMVTASQLNRGSYDEVEFDPSHIAGGISKVNTADNVVGIFTSAAMKESGRYQVQFMKTRSSSGVGQRVDLAFCPKTLRIYDMEEGMEGATVASTANIMDSLKKKSVVSTPSSTAGAAPTTSSTASTAPASSTDVASKAASLRSLLKKGLD